jgi:hypothetical protein
MADELYRTLNLPRPKLSPVERLRRRIAYRNFRTLYHRPSSFSGARLISMYSPNVPFPVVSTKEWWSESWDARDYGRAIDFTKPFFSQYQALAEVVPRAALSNLNSENSEYCNFVFASKGCYLVFGCVDSEDCLYGHIVWSCSSCLDVLYAYRCEWCSHSIDIVDCYDVHYSTDCTRCTESYFLRNCTNCQSCFGCTNLHNKRFCLFNEQLSEVEYLKRIAAYFPLTRERIQTITTAPFYRECLFPQSFGFQNEDISGNHIYYSKSCINCFDVKSSEGAENSFTAQVLYQCIDLAFNPTNTRFCADSLTVQNAERVFYSHLAVDSSDITLSEFVYSSTALFGCIGMRRGKYAILNREYPQAEYESLKARLLEHMERTGEWGGFFPMDLSPFAYNESIANEYLPLNREEALNRGLRWLDEEKNLPPPPLDRPLVPELITAADDAVPNNTYYCSVTKKPYKILAAELALCRRLKIPLPDTAPDTRHLRRMAMRAPRIIEQVPCGECGVGVQTSHGRGFAPGVLCDPCYRRRFVE